MLFVLIELATCFYFLKINIFCFDGYNNLSISFSFKVRRWYTVIIIALIVVIILTALILLLINANKIKYDNESLIDGYSKGNLSSDEIEKKAEQISKLYTVSKKASSRKRLIQNLDTSFNIFLKNYKFISLELETKRNVLSAAEWLLDNFYLIEKEYKDVKHNMPKSYYQNLPVIDKGLMRGYPRIYAIALEMVSYSGGIVDEELIDHFVIGYQRHNLLSSGEIWALPIMLRIALLQYISSISDSIVNAQDEKNKGEIIADSLITAYADGNLEDKIKELSEESICFSSHSIERILKVLRDNGVESKLIYTWIDEKLESQETNSEKMISKEHQLVSKFQINIGSCINSIREVEGLNWKENFEKISELEKILRSDPSGIYKDMDFETKDYYRHCVEKISKRFKLSEIYLARKAIECARDDKSTLLLKKHVGYYLMQEGVKCLKTKVGIKDKGFNLLTMKISKHSVKFYICINVIGTILLAWMLDTYIYLGDNYEISWKYFIALAALIIPCSEIINSILNWSINHLSEPAFIPKMEFKNGIPDEYKTTVVVPTLLTSERKILDLISDIEVYYMGNKDKNIYFAVLGDFADSKLEFEQKDNELIECALKNIKLLNKKYNKNTEDKFYFLNRYRMFNEKQRSFIGWERKRGKLMEFNALLRGDKNTSYNTISGNISSLMDVKYVITLDSDTMLPRDNSKKLIGAMAHILNVPVLSDDKKTVLRGHALMQPRVNISVTNAGKTLFSNIFSGETGIDIYTRAVSDVYQDLFDEGMYTGKGIYDIDVFNSILTGQIPENTVLSHDLLEGSMVRAALVTDIEFIDGYPAFYLASCDRVHRWIRGDWQIIPWLFKGNLNALSKWKIFDNLRRSLLAASLMTITILSFTLLNGSDGWLTVAVISLISPILFNVSDKVISPARGISLSGKIRDIKSAVKQFFLIFCFIPYQAYISLDAIIRTLYRLIISKKNLLEWQTSADAEAKCGRKLKDYISKMWVSSAAAALIAYFAFRRSTDIGFVMLPSSIIWFVSPFIAYYISKEVKALKLELSNDDMLYLRKVSRKTWAYFEDFLNEENNYLAPDNFQQYANVGLAARTSPTNMAMGVTCTISAYDFGYVGIIHVIKQLNNIIESMLTLRRYEGHFYNWYNTISKEPLHPMYISTVDSGNLVGYLWTTVSALKEYENNPLINVNLSKGLLDTLRLASSEMEEGSEIKKKYDLMIIQLSSNDFELIRYKNILVEILQLDFDETCFWDKKLHDNAEDYYDELLDIAPWMEVVDDIDNKIINRLFAIVTKTPIKDVSLEITAFLSEIRAAGNNTPIKYKKFEKTILKTKFVSEDIVNKIECLQSKLMKMVEETNFSILYDNKKELFSIGYDIEKGNIGNCYYDLLASEARQASFIAIAKGDVNQGHWFKLGRAIATIYGNKGLVSWSGTMFEYLMPLLIMGNFADTLLDETYKSIIIGQKKYCSKRHLSCWGISESAFSAVDATSTYQYKAFGVPGIGLKRGLENDLVLSPYSTVLAMQLDLKGSLENLKRLSNRGMLAKYGFYEAIDYTRGVKKERKGTIVKCFMVHHQGMSLMSLNNVINKNIFQKRFHEIPQVKATELLLQEKIPKTVVYEGKSFKKSAEVRDEKQNVIVRRFDTPCTEIPEANFLSNGSYSMMITNSGSGYSKVNDRMLYRWKEDTTVDDSGMFFYIKNINSNEYWSATFEPCRKEGDSYEAIFSLDKAEFERSDGSLITHTDITVSKEDDAEIREISITNHGEHSRTVEVTSYCEVTLAPYLADLVHPAFSNLFVKTEFVEQPMCLLANRRPRSQKDVECFVMQTAVVEGEQVGNVQFETSRANFIGRCRNLINPAAMDSDSTLKNSIGAVLDPIISLRIRVKIKKGETCKIAYSTAMCKSREEALELASKFRSMHSIKTTFELSWNQIQEEMRYLSIKPLQANMYQQMGSEILFLNKTYKKREEYIKNIKSGQSSLWAYGISGDLPIILLLIRKDEDFDLIRQLINAHEYLSIKGLKVDLVILNLHKELYLQLLQDKIRELISSSSLRDKVNKNGGVFLYSQDEMKTDTVNLLIAISKIVIDGDKETLLCPIKEKEKFREKENIINFVPQQYLPEKFNFEKEKLKFFNEIGGFSEDGSKYIIILKNGDNTPAPWINVISNGNFGFNVSENGMSCTWYKNSSENKITSWTDDPVIDGESEELYVQDQIDGNAWSISPKPIRDNGEYIIEHGFGYSTFKHVANSIVSEMTVFCPVGESVKICSIKLKNISDIQRKLRVVYYAKLVLGVVHEKTAQYLSTYINKENKYIYANNTYSEHFASTHAYLSIIGGENESFTGDRCEFIGRGGNIERPIALEKGKFENTSGAGLDPCLAEAATITLEQGEEKNIIILLGASESNASIQKVIDYYSDLQKTEIELNKVKDYWNELLERIKVKTPDDSMDVLINGWLMYQVISCRYNARTAFYQSGGAFGFRDQLQDVMAISYLDPVVTRKHIIYSASRQFLEGDVQHWWHPVVESGIRTRFSDDLLWLPFSLIDYIKNTGDYSILDEEAYYLEDEPLSDNEDERYKISNKSEQKGTIYEHCIKAIDKSLKYGIHDIPLMGSGDWNDGMSTVGNKGKGESVWLGWFLCSILTKFKDICGFKNDTNKAIYYEEQLDFIKKAVNKNAWNGSWYLRAFFDDGTPLGSIQNDECRIDSIAQSWSVISGAGINERSKEAMSAVERNLIKKEKGIVQLLTPAFEKSKLEPGYIKGYLPGVRENGGQYTHASIWVIIAFAMLNDGDKACQIFNMINPINHSRSYLDCQTYCAEPYVMAADVYTVDPHAGRGGWSWYTGAAGWMYRCGIENILGLKLKGEKGFKVEPCIPKEWEKFNIEYKHEKCKYNITIQKGQEKGVRMDNELLEGDIIPYLESGEHDVLVII